MADLGKRMAGEGVHLCTMGTSLSGFEAVEILNSLLDLKEKPIKINKIQKQNFEPIRQRGAGALEVHY